MTTKSVVPLLTAEHIKILALALTDVSGCNRRRFIRLALRAAQRSAGSARDGRQAAEGGRVDIPVD
ncbi:MAG: hypothetical protein CFK52_00350 [Chloracidobacterium sp. CP2_5A]|nr:MAG: hypothetical protein CFK52_00350 [Chloracidobacterium sp. CP2_5A]